MRTRVIRRLGLGTVAVASVIAAGAVSPAPAWANSTDCTYYSFGSCWTGPLPANRIHHALHMEAKAYAGPHATRCYLYDTVTWQIVGELWSKPRTTTKVVRGLYGNSYQMNCVRDGSGSGSGSGKISDDNWMVD